MPNSLLKSFLDNDLLLLLSSPFSLFPNKPLHMSVLPSSLGTGGKGHFLPPRVRL